MSQSSPASASIVNKMNWSELVHEYQLDAKRLLPWEGLNSPFGGAYCVVKANTQSKKHAHNEHEMFLCVQGRAVVVVDGEDIEMSQGDLIRIPLEQEHYIDNRTDEDFHLFTVWWDRDTASAYLKNETEI